MMLLLIGSIVFAQEQIPQELQFLQKQIQEIKQKKVSSFSKKISYLKNPFIFLEKNKTKKPEDKTTTQHQTTTTTSNSTSSASSVVTTHTNSNTIKKKSSKMKLYAIMNKSALIGGKWYKLGEYVYGYKIVQITLKDVVLENGMKRIILTTNKHRMKK